MNYIEGRLLGHDVWEKLLLSVLRAEMNRLTAILRNWGSNREELRKSEPGRPEPTETRGHGRVE